MGQKLRKLTMTEDGEKFTSFGLSVVNEPLEISGETWVEIQRYDDWSDHPKAYGHDAEAALAVARAGNGIAMWFNEDQGFPYPISKGDGVTPDEREWLNKQGRAHIICIVPATAARKAGLSWFEGNPAPQVVFRARTRGGKYEIVVIKTPRGDYEMEQLVGGRSQARAVGYSKSQIRDRVLRAVAGARHYDGINYKIEHDELDVIEPLRKHGFLKNLSACRNPRTWKSDQMKVRVSIDRIGSLVIEPVSGKRQRRYEKIYRDWHKGSEGESSVYIQEDYHIWQALDDLGLDAEQRDAIDEGWTETITIPVETFENMFGAFNQVPMGD